MYEDNDHEHKDQYEEEEGEASRPKASVHSLPVSEIETAETMTGSVRVTRSLSLPGGKNDVVHLGIEIPFPVQPQWSPEEIAVKAADICFQAKATVYEQLGLEFSIDEGGVLRETVRRHFPDAKPVRDDDEDRDERPARRSSGDGGSRRNGRDPHPADLDRPDHVSRSLWDDLVDNYDDWYDNRADKRSGSYKETAPDFKRSTDGKGIWLTEFRRPASQGRR